MPTSKRQHYSVGAIVTVPLDNTSHTYARLLPFAVIAFYDARDTSERTLADIVLQPILFKVCVMKHAITSGRWRKIGTLPLEEHLCMPVPFFRQAIGNPNSLFIYLNGHETPATIEQCLALERAAVWNPEHVEERLRDYYAGRTNRWVESLSLRRATK